MTVHKFKLFRKGKFVGYEHIYRRINGSYRIHHADIKQKDSELRGFRPVFAIYMNGESSTWAHNFIPHDRAECIEENNGRDAVQKT